MFAAGVTEWLGKGGRWRERGGFTCATPICQHVGVFEQGNRGFGEKKKKKVPHSNPLVRDLRFFLSRCTTAARRPPPASRDAEAGVNVVVFMPSPGHAAQATERGNVARGQRPESFFFCFFFLLWTGWRLTKGRLFELCEWPNNRSVECKLHNERHGPFAWEASMTVVLSNIDRNGQIRLELVDQSEKHLLQCSSSCCQLRELGMSKVQHTIRRPPGCRYRWRSTVEPVLAFLVPLV